MIRRHLCSVLFLLLPTSVLAQAPVVYRLTFPEPEHRWMQIDVTFADLLPDPLQLRMSRSSPGRYALHEFAKNVFDVRVTNGPGQLLVPARPNPHQWDVSGHGGTVKVSYKVFGDRIDGTYLAIDSTHAHINMPAALMWARGLEQRPVHVQFEPPPGVSWRVATQLTAGPEPHTFRAPNLQYLMDSPAEFSAFSLRTFVVEEEGRKPTIQVAVHHTGDEADVDAYAGDVEKIVREMRHIFGEYPRFENNTYTFIADYLPWAMSDGMEHRNSTVLTNPASLQGGSRGLLGTASHEFFHAWNVERIRPRSLEPFDFEDANMSGELWFAEGFTSYYGPLVMCRAGLTAPADYARDLADAINTVTLSAGRRLRSAEDMSRLAPFVDAAAAMDRTSFDNTYISYYTWGAALGLGLDLSLRERTGGRVTLDHFMRAMWNRFGRSGERVPGYVERPYTMADLKATLASVSGDAAFADDFFSRYIQGHEVVDYSRLLAQAGFSVKPASPGAAWAGELDVEGAGFQRAGNGLRIARAVPFGSPAYEAGLERDDTIVSIDGRRLDPADSLAAVLQKRKPGDTVAVMFERRGERLKTSLRLVADPRIEIEDGGSRLTDAQKRFREAWLSSQRRPAAARVLKSR